MIKWLIGTLPDWMQKRHPTMRYLVAREQKTSRLSRVLVVISLFFIVIMFGMIGYANASTFFRSNPMELPFSMLVFEFLFWSVLVLQVGVALIALLPLISFVNTERGKRTWDAIRTTYRGVNGLLRARWAMVTFYRLSPILIVLWGARLVLIVGLLYDLTAFQGEYLLNLSANIIPGVPPALVLVLVTMGITASLLMPLTAIGFNTALGLLLGTFVKKRVYVALLQSLLVLVQIMIVGGFVILFLSIRDEQVLTQLLLQDNNIQLSTGILWVLMLGFAIFADWGITFLYLGLYAGIIWAKIPYGIFLGAVALFFVLLQAFLTDRLLGWAVYRAERQD